MEVLQDTYKDTKIGRIPKDWEVVRLKKLLSKPTEYGANASAIDFTEHTYRYIRITDILSDGRLNKTGIVGILKQEGKKYLLNQDDIIIARTGNTVGKSHLYNNTDGDCAYAGYLIRFVVNEELLLPQYLFQYLQSNLFWNWVKRIVRTGAQPNINSKEYQSMNIPLPKIPEQQKIADILSTVDEQISTTDKIIEKSKELKKGLMQRFFLNKAYMIMSLGKLEKTELMPIRFNQLGKILTGTTPPTANKEYYDTEDYMFIGPADLGKVKDVKNSKKYISVKGFDVTRKLPENALMVVCIGATIGKIGLTTEPCATNQQVNTIVPKDEYSARYLYYVIGGLKKYLLGFAGDTATPQLNKTDFGKVVTFIHKSKSERTKIAAILSEADAKIEKEQEQKTKLEQLKKGLMQQLLTGKKRVKV